MNERSIEEAIDDDIRLSGVALQRAALRAWEVAKQTGTAIVIKDNGIVREIRPSEGDLEWQLSRLRGAETNPPTDSPRINSPSLRR